MRSLLPLVALTAVCTAAMAAPLAPGASLPPLRGELLTGRSAELPALTLGKVALIVFGFSRASSDEVEAWAARFKSAHAADTTHTWLEVPLIGSSMGRMMKPVIQGAMRGGTPEADRVHVMTVFGGTREWKDRLAFQDSRSAYVVLLDREGRVRWRGAGPPGEARWQAMTAAADSIR